MKIEDKAYFAIEPNLQGMKKVRDEIYALAQTHLRLSEKSTDSQKQNYEYRIAAGLSSFVSRAPYAAEIGMEFKGSAYWNKKAIQLAKEGAALGVIADKLIAEALSIYNSHSKPVEDKAYFAANKNSEALKQALTDTNYNISDVVKHNEEDVGTLAGSGNFTVKIGMGRYENWFYKITPSGKYKKNSVRKLDFARQGNKAVFEHNLTRKISLQESNSPTQVYKITEELYNKAALLKNKSLGYFELRTLIEKALATGEAVKMSRTGTKTKFANRGAFAEASSSPVLGSLLEKKVMPEGGWRAVETDGAALVIAFEDGDIAGNFARRAAENGYSATAPMAMAGRYWNVKVQNENKN